MVWESMGFVYLSYVLSESTPVYGNGMSLVREVHKDMGRGDSCNTQYWQLSNHIGTHVDAPRHFSGSGSFLDHYPADFWVCNHVCHLVLPPVADKQIIGEQDFNAFEIPGNTDLLLVQTGFGKKRAQREYMMENPGFDPGLADFFRAQCPKLKMIGFDGISLSSFASRDIGRKAHQAFLDHDAPILIIEDMDLSGLDKNSRIHQVAVCPIRVEKSDAAPCTIIADIQEEML